MAEPKPTTTKSPEHTRGGVTTRNDVTDLGVPMAPGKPDEPIGPEDAFDTNTRGDYSNRLHFGPSVRIAPKENPKEGEPTVEVVEQAPGA